MIDTEAISRAALLMNEAAQRMTNAAHLLDEASRRLELTAQKMNNQSYSSHEIKLEMGNSQAVSAGKK